MKCDSNPAIVVEMQEIWFETSDCGGIAADLNRIEVIWMEMLVFRTRSYGLEVVMKARNVVWVWLGLWPDFTRNVLWYDLWF